MDNRTEIELILSDLRKCFKRLENALRQPLPDDPNAHSQMPQKWRDYLAGLEDREVYPWAAIDPDGELMRYGNRPSAAERSGFNGNGYFLCQDGEWQHVAHLSPEEMKGIDDWKQTVYLIPHGDDFGKAWNQRMDELGAEKGTTEDLLNLDGEDKP